MRITRRTIIALAALRTRTTVITRLTVVTGTALVAGLTVITRTALVTRLTLARLNLFADRLGHSTLIAGWTFIAGGTVTTWLRSRTGGDGFGLVTSEANIRTTQTEQITTIAAQRKALADDFDDSAARDLSAGQRTDYTMILGVRLTLTRHRHDTGLCQQFGETRLCP
jgi:hypothetical protein